MENGRCRQEFGVTTESVGENDGGPSHSLCVRSV